MGKLGLREVLATLNNLIESGVIKDYAIGGGYAVMFYDIPLLTYDLDVLVVLSSEEDYHRLYQHFREKGCKIEDVYIYIHGMPVQFLPNYISPLFNTAIEEASEVEFKGIRSKFVNIEYLIVLLLTSFRLKDRIRIQSLLGKADSTRLLSIIQRFDNDQRQLYKRYNKILAET